MFSITLKFTGLLCLLFVFAASTNAQRTGSVLFPEKDSEERTETAKAMIAKQQAAREKKEHAELLTRGEELLKLSEQLEKSLENSKDLSAADKKRLETLEKLAKKIRDDLGGDDDQESVEADLKDKQFSVKEAFSYLKSTTSTLVAELKKTSRFTVSVLAIQTSNSVIRLTRLLRFRN